MSYIIAFLVGMAMDALCTFQHVNSANNRWHLSFPTSLLISVCIWVNTKYVVDGMLTLFVVFSIGGAFGASLGVWLGNRGESVEWDSAKPFPRPPWPHPRGR